MAELKEEIIGTVKKTAVYKLLKTSEAVLVVGGMALGIFLGWFALIPALIGIVAYVVLNVIGLSNEPLYILRDRIIEEKDKL